MRSFFPGRNPHLATIRLRVPVGIIYPEQLDILKEVAIRYGDGRLHLTVRKTVEIPGVPCEQVGAALARLNGAGWYSSSFGDNVRNIIACPGKYSCPNAQVYTQAIGLELDSALVEVDHLPAKVKIAIAGCPNACTHPLGNDIGIVGFSRIKVLSEKCSGCYFCLQVCREGALKATSNGKVALDRTKCIDCGDCIAECHTKAIICEKNGFRIYLGGKMGRHPRFGQEFGDFTTIPELLEQAEKIITVYYRHGKKDERFGDFIDRISLEGFKKLLDASEANEIGCLPLGVDKQVIPMIRS